MSSEFTPVNMRRIATDDALYSRQSPSKATQKPEKMAAATVGFIPSNDDIQTKVSSALESMKRNAFPDRGAILNILI